MAFDLKCNSWHELLASASSLDNTVCRLSNINNSIESKPSDSFGLADGRTYTPLYPSMSSASYFARGPSPTDASVKSGSGERGLKTGSPGSPNSGTFNRQYCELPTNPRVKQRNGQPVIETPSRIIAFSEAATSGSSLSSYEGDPLQSCYTASHGSSRDNPCGSEGIADLGLTSIDQKERDFANNCANKNSFPAQIRSLDF